MENGRIGRAARGFGGAIGAIVGWAGIAEAGRWICRGADMLSPKRFPWSKRAEWSNPAPSKETFDGAAYRLRADEERIRRSHAMLAASSLIAGTGCLAIVGFGISHAMGGSAAGVMASIGMAAVTGAVAATHSFRCWKLRTRDINSGMADFAASPKSWIPPLSYRRGA